MPDDPAPAPVDVNAWAKDAPPEILGKWTEKGYFKVDPVTKAPVAVDAKTVAIEATRAYLSAESLIGGDPNLMIRLPKSATEPGWDKVWSKLGAPDKPEGYDFTAVKGADGKPIAQSLVDAIRKTAFDNHLPVTAATALADTVVKQQEAAATATALERNTKLLAQREALKTSWGADKYEAKLFAAKSAAAALKVTKDQLDALQENIGYDGVMQMFLDISTKIGEDKFVDGNPGGNTPNLMTKDQAKAELEKLRKDKAWGARILNGDVEALKQSKALAAIIAGDDTLDSRQRAGK
jgi:hypothetical protein